MKIGPGAVTVLLPLVLLQYAVGGAFYPFLGPYLESAKGFEVRDLSMLALGAGVVNCVMPRTYHKWVSGLRRRVLTELPVHYAENTPMEVIELKRHPLWLKYYQEEIHRHTAKSVNCLKKNLLKLRDWKYCFMLGMPCPSQL